MKAYLETRDYAVSGEVFTLKYDEKFQMLITDPRPTDLARYYQSEDYISHSDSSRGLINKAYQFVKKRALRRKLRLVESYTGSGKSVLDVGAGTGDFVLAARNAGLSATGIEPVKAARAKAAAKGVLLEKEIKSIEGSKFEVITLWHVLEHLPDLDVYLDRLLSLLDSKGTLILALPNYRSWDARFYGVHWAAYDVPRHLWHFSRKSIHLLFEQKGCKVVRTLPMWYDAFYISLLSEKYKKGRPGYWHAIVNGMRSNLSAISDGEFSSLIYVIQRVDKAK